MPPPKAVIHRVATAATSMEAIKEHLPLKGSSGGPVAVLVAEQTAGRGTGGRPWASPKGNMHLTVAVPMPPMPQLYSVPLLVGLSVHDAVAAWTSKVAASDRGLVRLKWPNDVLLGDRKVAGTIIESSDGGELIIGIGVNCAIAPQVPDGGRESCCLHELLPTTAPDAGSSNEEDTAGAIATLCCDALAKRLQGANDGTLRRSELMAEYGRKMNLEVEMFRRLPGGERGGAVRAKRLTSDGHLVVTDAGGVEDTLFADYLF